MSLFKQKRKLKGNTLSKRERAAFNAVFAAIAFLISALCAVTGGFAGEGYDLRPGVVSNRRIQAPFDVVNETATRTRRDQAAERARANLIYRQDNDVTQHTMYRLHAFFEEIEDMRRLHNPIPDPTRPWAAPVPLETLDRTRLQLDVSITEHFRFLITSPSDIYYMFRETILTITETRMNSGITVSGLPIIQNAVRDEERRVGFGG
jgi:membrane-associated HD superfamily phosphohydrolase